MSGNSSATIYVFLLNCLNSRIGLISVTSFTIANVVLVLPLCVLVIYLGLKQWRERRPGTAFSHSDVFTYHIVATEMAGLLGAVLMSCGVHTQCQIATMLGVHLCSINVTSQLYFHVLTCIERYLAVVHPITYLSLKKPKWILIRNVTIANIWLTCILLTGIIYSDTPDFMAFLSISFIAVIFGGVTFCSLSVLSALSRPGPGERGGRKQQLDQSKLRAFYTIMAIMGVLLLRLLGNILGGCLYALPDWLLQEEEVCGVWLSAHWFSFPSSLVLPLLFLHRAKNLLCCKKNSDSVKGLD